MPIEVSRPGYRRVIDPTDTALRCVGRFDCAFKRALDGEEKKITRCAFMIVPNAATYDVEAVKHSLNVRYANGILLTVRPGDSVKAYNNMQCSVRNAATALTLTACPKWKMTRVCRLSGKLRRTTRRQRTRTVCLMRRRRRVCRCRCCSR